MVKSALGIIFPNQYDELVPELTSERLMASIPFASRYRMIDFALSSMVNSGITNISVLARQNYHSLMDHLGAGREWDLVRKNGGLTVWPPFAEKTMSLFKGRIEALVHIVSFLTEQKEKYVILSDTNIATSFDFKKFIQAHIDSEAAVTVAYTRQPLPESAMAAKQMNKGMYYTYDIRDGVVTNMYINAQEPGEQNFGMNIYCIDRELLIRLVKETYMLGGVYFERDVLLKKLDEMKVVAYRFDGYYGRISDMKSYFDENMRLLEEENLEKLFSTPVYTKLRDDNPTRYINGSSVRNVMAADGCVIEGTVENCVLFRGVRVGHGAVVKNCVLMQDTVVEPGASLEYIITDKNATITEGKEVKGTDTFPVFVAKHQIV
ncbi:MAG: glucose-1-phosphate adenylyltransferase subunit GlgD [Lachnospiraceae bacterium]|nr:glucose-1-phosphate adenylyltransferase subunit GlgD [Lachnospiraceae bacterium]